MSETWVITENGCMTHALRGELTYCGRLAAGDAEGAVVCSSCARSMGLSPLGATRLYDEERQP